MRLYNEYLITRIVALNVSCVTCPRSGPNWRSLREPLGQWRGTLMLHAASTMESSCLSLVEWMLVAALWAMHGFWMSTLGSGVRWVVSLHECILHADWDIVHVMLANSPLNTELFLFETGFRLYMLLTYRISICVQPLTPKLNLNPLPALASRLVTLTTTLMQYHHYSNRMVGNQIWLPLDYIQKTTSNLISSAGLDLPL